MKLDLLLYCVAAMGCSLGDEPPLLTDAAIFPDGWQRGGGNSVEDAWDDLPHDVLIGDAEVSPPFDSMSDHSLSTDSGFADAFEGDRATGNPNANPTDASEVGDASRDTVDPPDSQIKDGEIVDGPD